MRPARKENRLGIKVEGGAEGTNGGKKGRKRQDNGIEQHGHHHPRSKRSK